MLFVKPISNKILLLFNIEIIHCIVKKIFFTEIEKFIIGCLPMRYHEQTALQE